MRRHWQFINELILFEIEHHKRYGISVYGSPREPDFLQAASIYHPDTVERSIKHDGSGSEPGIKDPSGKWDVRPHSSRIVRVTTETLASWHAVLETDETPISDTRMIYAVNRSTAAVLDKLARSSRVGELGLLFSRGWDESIDRKKGRFDSEWGVPESWNQAILQGPHIHVGTPFFKTPNSTMLNNQDWTATDFEALPPEAVPATSYKPRGDTAEYDASYTHWEVDGERVPARSQYRLAWRNMAANTGERTFIPALIPPGPAHIHGISSVALPGDPRSLALAAGFASSFVLDFGVRVAPKSTISAATLSRLPIANVDGISPAINLRILRLSCVTSAYAELWGRCFEPAFNDDAWAGGVKYDNRVGIGNVGATWSENTVIRRAADRRQAQLEIDALVAIAIGITADELSTIYQTQFPVLFGYDQDRDHYDEDGRLVPTPILNAWKKATHNAGADILTVDLTSTHPGSGKKYRFRPPFVTLDREADLRAAYASFAGRFGTSGPKDS